jgi:hypothetical protein
VLVDMRCLFFTLPVHQEDVFHTAADGSQFKAACSSAIGGACQCSHRIPGMQLINWHPPPKACLAFALPRPWLRLAPVRQRLSFPCSNSLPRGDGACQQDPLQAPIFRVLAGGCHWWNSCCIDDGKEEGETRLVANGSCLHYVVPCFDGVSLLIPGSDLRVRPQGVKPLQ